MDYEAPLEEGATRLGYYTHALERFEQAISNDLNTADALVTLDEIVDRKKMHADDKLRLLATVDGVLGLGLLELKRAALRVRPRAAAIAADEIEAILARRSDERPVGTKCVRTCEPRC